MKQIQILLLDGEQLVVDGLAAIFEREADFAVLGRPTSVAEALELCMAHQPDLVVFGLPLMGIGVSTFARSIRSRAPEARLLAVAALTDVESLRAVVEARVDGCASRATSAADFVQSARLIAHGQTVYPSGLRSRLTDKGEPRRGSSPLALTDRECEVLRLVALGATSREIAEKLILSAKTVDNHRSRILEKLQVRNKAEAVALAIRRGVLELDLIDHRPRLVVSADTADAATGAPAPNATGDVTAFGATIVRRAPGRGGVRRGRHPEAARAQCEIHPNSGAA